MGTNEAEFERDAAREMPQDLRQRLSALLIQHTDTISADTVAIFPYSGPELMDHLAYCDRLGRLLVQLLSFAIRDGHLDARLGFVADLHRVAMECPLSLQQLFTLAYLTERTALDELALNDDLGATSEPWPLVAQLVRRASFDLLAAYVERTHLEPTEAAITDRLTTLYTRPMLEAVLAKEIERASRFGHAISLILFDVDNLSAINQQHGYGVGDRILERVGILIRTYFRQHDWVARHSEDSIAVLLTRTDAENTAELAEKTRSTVEERLGFIDHHTDRPVTVTVSGAVINIQVAVGDVIDPDRLMADAEAALDRAKRQGRNRIERVDSYSGKAPAEPGSS
jgi:diguanylate cyclase (GGDEF)-like protein